MGLIQWHARGVRDTWSRKLESLRVASLQEHISRLEKLYEEYAGAALRRPLVRCAAGPLEGHWLVCEEIGMLWDNLMGGTELPMDDPPAYGMVIEHMLYVKGGQSA